MAHLSKPAKEKNITKDKLIGMKVIDGEGKLVGTVKDVGFTVGKAGISLSIEGADGEAMDISWESIQGASDFVVLKPVAQETVAAFVAQPVQQAQPVQVAQAQPVQQAQQNQAVCPTCKGALTYIPQYQRWYCYTCKKYT